MQTLPLSYSVLAEGRRIERPYLSPNGTAVAWTQETEGQSDLFVASGGQVRRLTETPENEGFALVSDDARTVAFTRRSAQSNVWQLHVQRNGQEGVLEAGGHHVQSASLSADGHQIAWENHGRVTRTDPETVLANVPQPRHGDHDSRQLKPQLSGDGQTLLFQVSDLDSAESHLVVTSPHGDREIDNNTDAPTALSFDGGKVVYPTTDEEGFHDLSMLDLASGRSTVVSDLKGADESHPSVSVDGKVVFQLTRYDQNAQPLRSIALLTPEATAEIVAADELWEPSHPQLSADGKTLLWLATSKLDSDRRQLRLARL